MQEITRGCWQICYQYSKPRELVEHQGYKNEECIVGDPRESVGSGKQGQEDL